ncbi:MAG: hypothetical protein AYK19_05650 [Theionarchaea archaeon DG-70-1]|nr:MAG: hypothetical protein AYK19_05650 [Theionarchaea archaeon DG-70-1]
MQELGYNFYLREPHVRITFNIYQYETANVEIAPSVLSSDRKPEFQVKFLIEKQLVLFRRKDSYMLNVYFVFSFIFF